MKKGMRKSLFMLLMMIVLTFVTALSVSAATPALNKKTATIRTGQTVTLKVNNTKKTVTWSTSDKSVAAVTSKGVVKGIKRGKATITAKFGTKKLTCTVTVLQPVTKITLSATKKTIMEGKGFTLKATAGPANANNKTVTFTSSDKTVATVNAKGYVAAKKPGKATITVKANDGSGVKATCVVTVKKTTQKTMSAEVKSLRDFILAKGRTNSEGDKSITYTYNENGNDVEVEIAYYDKIKIDDAGNEIPDKGFYFGLSLQDKDTNDYVELRFGPDLVNYEMNAVALTTMGDDGLLIAMALVPKNISKTSKLVMYGDGYTTAQTQATNKYFQIGMKYWNQLLIEKCNLSMKKIGFTNYV